MKNTERPARAERARPAAVRSELASGGPGANEERAPTEKWADERPGRASEERARIEHSNDVPARVFLLSPADCSGKRASMLRNPEAEFEVARRLQSRGGAELGEVFSFMSSLYFRGKLAYARAFARSDRGVLVITPGDGLRPPEVRIGVNDLRRYARVPVDPSEQSYRAPLLRDVRELARRSPTAEVVLLGSIASRKYTDLMESILGPRLLFPADFVGRGDMSRGGLMLRCAREGRELAYVTVAGAQRHGVRPARLPPLPRSGVAGG